MRVLVMTSEYPPHIVGGLGRHVAGLTRALAQRGASVTVLTALGAVDAAPEREEQEGLFVYRVKDAAPAALSFTEEVVQRNVALLQAALNVWAEGRRFDLVHAHDWLTAHAARAVKHALGIPLIATIHATEYGRHGGLFTDLQRRISDIEWWLAYEAWRVICCSRAMQAELQRIFQVPADKLSIVPNGIDLCADGVTDRHVQPVRRRYARDGERLLFFVGRLVYEKGVDLLLQALPAVLASHPSTVLVVAGKGPERERLGALAHALGIADRVRFAGHISDDERNTLYRAADAAVFPSRYEPFGIVALEAMALGAPLVAARTGGLAEVVEHGRTGLLVPPGDAHSLAQQLIALLDAPARAEAMARRARRSVAECYSWSHIADMTLDVYRLVLDAAEAARAGAVSGRPARSESPRVYA